MEILLKEVHDAIDQAAELMRDTNPSDFGKAHILKLMGFCNAQNVIDEDDWREHHHYAQYYAQHYPMYQFITHIQLERIKEKYDLRDGYFENFYGNIPLKNINDMLYFRISEKDIDQRLIRLKQRSFDYNATTSVAYAFGMMTSRSSDEINGNIGGIGQIVSFEDPYEFDRIKVVQLIKPIPSDLINRSLFTDFYKDTEKTSRQTGNVSLTLADINKRVPGAAMITAPLELFYRPAYLDPIVHVAVNGGYLVATAWGPEASDPDVVNNRMN